MIKINSEALPDAVVYPEKVEQISKLLAFCNRNKIPVIPWGAGSGFEGGVNAIKVKILSFSIILRSTFKRILYFLGWNNRGRVQAHGKHTSGERR